MNSLIEEKPESDVVNNSMNSFLEMQKKSEIEKSDVSVSNNGALSINTRNSQMTKVKEKNTSFIENNNFNFEQNQKQTKESFKPKGKETNIMKQSLSNNDLKKTKRSFSII